MRAGASRSHTADTCSIRGATHIPGRARSCSTTRRSCSCTSARSRASGSGALPRTPTTSEHRSAVDLDLRDTRDVCVGAFGVVPPDVVYAVAGLVFVGEVHGAGCAVVVDVRAGFQEGGA